MKGLLLVGRLVGRRAAAFALAGVLTLAAVIAGAAAALALTAILAFAVMLGRVLLTFLLRAGIHGSEGFGRERAGIETGHGCSSDEETSGFVHLIWDFSFCVPILRQRHLAGSVD